MSQARHTTMFIQALRRDREIHNVELNHCMVTPMVPDMVRKRR